MSSRVRFSASGSISQTTTSQPTSKSHDPIRLYMRKMGSVSLLDREGEVAIAKRIEEGENKVFSVILNCPITVDEIIALGDKIKKGKIRAIDIVKNIDEDEEDFIDEEELKERVVSIIAKIRSDANEINKQRGILKTTKYMTEKRRKRIEDKITRLEAKILHSLHELHAGDV